MIILMVAIYVIMPKEYSVDVYTHPAFILQHVALMLFLTTTWVRSKNKAHFEKYIEWYMALVVIPSASAYLLTRHHAIGRHDSALQMILYQSCACILISRVRFCAVSLIQLPITIVYCVDVAIAYRPSYVVWGLFVVFPLALSNIMDRRTRVEFTHIDKLSQQRQRTESHVMSIERKLCAAFPPTAKRHIVDVTNVRVGATYPKTVIIITDMTGFATYTIRTAPSIVVHSLGKVFHKFDCLAEAHGVERISTVGDTYMAALFSLQKVGDAPERMAATGERVIRAFDFCFAIISQQCEDLPLRLRVGVNVGDVEGGFVGWSPPVFDLFGKAVEMTKLLARTCSLSSRVHIRPDVHRNLVEGDFGEPVNVTRTPHGFLLSGWEKSTRALRASEGTETSSPITPTGTQDTSLDSSSLLHVLNGSPHRSVASSGVSFEQCWEKDDNQKDGNDDGAASSLSVAPAATSGTTTLSDAESVFQNCVKNVETMSSAFYAAATAGATSSSSGFGYGQFNPCGPGDDLLPLDHNANNTLFTPPSLQRHRWLRNFCDAHVEAEYQQSVRQLVRYQRHITFALFLALISTCVLFTLYSCYESSLDRLIVSLAVSLTLFYAVVSSAAYVPYYVSFAVMFITFHGCAWTANFSSHDCFIHRTDDRIQNSRYVGLMSVKGVFALLRDIAAPTFFMVSLKVRLFTIFITLISQTSLEHLSRDAVLDDLSDSSYFDELRSTLTSIVVFLFVAVSMDEALRDGFTARKRLQVDVHECSIYTSTIRSALGIMLPPFAAKRVLRRDVHRAVMMSSSEQQHNRSFNLTHSSSMSSASINTDDKEVDAMLVWDYSTVILAFVSFEIKHEDSAYDVAASLLEAIERTAHVHSVRKVKSTGTTILIAAGSDFTDLETIQENAERMCYAMLDVMQWVFTPQRDVCDFRIGIHAGPCFGAVVGTHFLTFDVFGDTVHVASAVANSAELNTAYVSAYLKDCVGGVGEEDLSSYTSGSNNNNNGVVISFTSVALSTAVKDKGTLRVFRMEGGDAMPSSSLVCPPLEDHCVPEPPLSCNIERDIKSEESVAMVEEF
eukprot:PhM_4_TR18653/c0_g1_i2/m.75739